MTAGLLLYLVAIFVGTLAGGLIPLARNWSSRGLLIPVSFSGGVLLGAAFFHMIPEAAQLLGRALGWPLLAGFLTIFTLERFVLVHPVPEEAAEHGRPHHLHFGLAAYFGLSFHSLLDGIAVTSAYERPDLGGVVLLAVIFHKIPDAFALAGLLMLDRWPKRAIAFLLTIFALITPIGAMLTWFALDPGRSSIVAGAVALSAGTFLAVATSDILPQLRRFDHQRLMPMVALFVGIAFSWMGRLIEG